MSQPIEAKAKIQIGKPTSEVFEAIIDPTKMANYFIAKGSSRMEEGKDLIWNFPEFTFDVPIKVLKVVPDTFVSFNWEPNNADAVTEITLIPTKNNATIVSVREKGKQNDEEGIEWALKNTEGWANFLACLKAYMEYGINLRTGAFDFMKN